MALMTTKDVSDLVAAQNSKNRKSVPEFLKKQFRDIYIYNTFENRWKQDLGGLGSYYIHACEAGRQFSRPTLVKGFVADEYDEGDGKGSMSWTPIEGTDIAKAIVGITSHSPAIGVTTTNLEWWGVFIAKDMFRCPGCADERAMRETCETCYGMGRVPGQLEIAAAREKLTQLMKVFLADADRLALNGDKGLLEIGIPHRQAALLLKQPRTWSSPVQAMVDCLGCGNPVKPGIAKCGACGAILDRAKAIELGLIPPPPPEPKPAELRK